MSLAYASESYENAPRNLESRLQDLSQKYGVKERTPREPARIRAQIANLEARKSKLLARYTPTHPGVLQIDRQLIILRQRLSELESAQPTTALPAP